MHWETQERENGREQSKFGPNGGEGAALCRLRQHREVEARCLTGLQKKWQLEELKMSVKVCKKAGSETRSKEVPRRTSLATLAQSMFKKDRFAHAG